MIFCWGGDNLILIKDCLLAHDLKDEQKSTHPRFLFSTLGKTPAVLPIQDASREPTTRKGRAQLGTRWWLLGGLDELSAPWLFRNVQGNVPTVSDNDVLWVNFV